MKKLIWSKILFGIGIFLLVYAVVGVVYFNNFVEYSPYQSFGGAETDALIHCLLLLPPAIMSLVASWVLWRKCKNKRKP